MANQPNWNPNSEEYLYNTTELLDAIFQEEDIYPWNPTAPEAEAYFADSERDFSLTNSLDSTEIESLAETFFSHLNQCWNNSASSRLQESLIEKKFVPQAPWNQLSQIQKARCTIVMAHFALVQLQGEKEL